MFCLQVYVPHACSAFRSQKEGIGSPRTRVTENCRLLCGWLSRRTASVLLTAEPPLRQHPNFPFSLHLIIYTVNVEHTDDMLCVWSDDYWQELFLSFPYVCLGISLTQN